MITIIDLFGLLPPTFYISLPFRLHNTYQYYCLVFYSISVENIIWLTKFHNCKWHPVDQIKLTQNWPLNDLLILNSQQSQMKSRGDSGNLEEIQVIKPFNEELRKCALTIVIKHSLGLTVSISFAILAFFYRTIWLVYKVPMVFILRGQIVKE